MIKKEVWEKEGVEDGGRVGGRVNNYNYHNRFHHLMTTLNSLVCNWPRRRLIPPVAAGLPPLVVASHPVMRHVLAGERTLSAFCPHGAWRENAFDTGPKS